MPEVEILATARLALAGVLSVIGALLLLAAAVGVVRQPDAFARAHAVALVDGAGGVCLGAGLAIASWDWRIAVLIGVLVGLRIAWAPSILRLIAQIAFAAGETPRANRAGSAHAEPP